MMSVHLPAYAVVPLWRHDITLNLKWKNAEALQTLETQTTINNLQHSNTLGRNPEHWISQTFTREIEEMCANNLLLAAQSWHSTRSSVTITIEGSTNGTTTIVSYECSGYVGRVTMFSWNFIFACCLVLGLGLRLRLGFDLDLVSGWLVVMHTYLYYFRVSIVIVTMLELAISSC